MIANVVPMRQQVHSYHLALSLILLFLTVYPYLFNNYNVCCSVAAYSGDDLYLKHNSIEKFDIIESDDIILSRMISIRSATAQLLHEHDDVEQQQQERPNHPAGLEHKSNGTLANKNKVSDAIYHPLTMQEPTKKVHFSSLGRRFNLVLGKPSHLITDDLTIVTLDGDGKETRVPFNRNDLQVMKGYIYGEARSLALVAFSQSSNKLMTAQINSGQDTFIVEPAYLHKNELKYSSEEHALDNDIDLSRIHNDSMIVYNLRDHRQFQYDGTQDETNGNHSIFNPEQLCGAVKLNETSSNDEFKEQDPKSLKKSRARDKRSIELLMSQDELKDKTRCTLHLVADYLFYKHVGNGDLQTTINYLLALINRVNLIYLPTVWDTGEDRLNTLTNIGFTVQNITIHQEYTRAPSNDAHYNMQSEKLWGARDFLDNFSRNSPPRHYCLAHLLTYRKFDSPVLGLAYVASTRFGTIGGICSPTQHMGDRFAKYNTGISTSRGIHGETLITRQADLVLAHELGHNLGAEHDSNECRPDPSNGGAFLMHPFAVMGFEKNNRFLSNCSRLSIGRVIKRKGASCFIGVVDNVCGNGIVEGDEECDGGDVGHGHSDPCCDSFCRFTPGSKCSDRHSWCCSRCRIVPAGRPCRPAEEYNCRQAASCDGHSAECPVAQPVEDDRTCVGRGLCRKGDCIPFCEARGLQSCLCNTPADACKLCCKTSINSTCVPYDTRASYLPDGVLCYRGVCEKGRCEQPIQDVVQRLWDVIEDINFTTFGKFLRDNIILVVLVASIPIWCVITHYINEFDKRIKQDVISALIKNRRHRKPGEISRSPFLPRLFVGDEASTNSADDVQNSRNETLQPLKPMIPSMVPGNSQGHPSPSIGFQPPNIGFQLPDGEEVAVEPRGSIAMNSIELPQQGGSNVSRSSDASNRFGEDDEVIVNAYSTQV